MLTSMTGYGNGLVSREGLSVSVEIRSVNNRFCEIVARVPKALQSREQEIKDRIRGRVNRGKINVNVILEKENRTGLPLKIDEEKARAYAQLLEQLRSISGIEPAVSLDTLLTFSDVLTPLEENESGDEDWGMVCAALDVAIEELQIMRRNEGSVIDADLRGRIALLAERIMRIEDLSKDRSELEKKKLRVRIADLIETGTIDENRLEMEIALLADKLDITEECVRLRSHLQFFHQMLDGEESNGRKLNFLLQEMNREANTIGAKSFDAPIAHTVVEIKDEIERIREQIQNVE